MHTIKWLTLVICASLASFAEAAMPPFPLPPPFTSDESAACGVSTFEQLIDHDHPELGTFPQRYWWNAEWWKGEGSPVVLFTPGETSATNYTAYITNKTITGVFAQNIGGAVVMIEHRYWGESSPFSVLSTTNLQYLTLRQSIADLTHFAQTVRLPFDTLGNSNSGKAPWVLSGGSYGGALSAWTESTSPGTFWAYHASSAPVEAIYDYWRYIVPIQQGMPANCSKDVSTVVNYIDRTLQSGNTEKKQELKNMFGLGALEHDDDFASALQNGPWLWQDINFFTGYSAFYQFCDAVENVIGGEADVPGSNGVGLEKALNGYAKWFNTTFLPGYCASYGYWTDQNSIECFDTYDASNPIYTDTSVSQGYRQWIWFLCNEPLAYWEDGAPGSIPTIFSRLVTTDYWQRQCDLYFPPGSGYTYGSFEGRTVENVNLWTKGWSLINTTRLIWTNGQFDPWRESGVSSDARPGGPLQNTYEAPLQIIPGGFHCSDLIQKNGLHNAGAQRVIDNEVAQIKTWVDEYYHQKK